MSTTDFFLRYAREDDAPALLDIYTPYVVGTSVTFEYEPPTVDEFAGRIREFSAVYPYIVCVGSDGLTGYAYAHRFQSRAAYQWGVECSIYIRQDHTRAGLGRLLYSELLRVLTAQNVRMAYSAISTPNEPSERLHLELGFTEVGRWRDTGYKLGGWHDVVWYEKPLNPLTTPPPPIIPVGLLPEEIRALRW